MVAELARRTPKGEWIVTMPLGDPPVLFLTCPNVTRKNACRRAGI